MVLEHVIHEYNYTLVDYADANVIYGASIVEIIVGLNYYLDVLKIIVAMGNNQLHEN